MRKQNSPCEVVRSPGISVVSQPWGSSKRQVVSREGCTGTGLDRNDTLRGVRGRVKAETQTQLIDKRPGMGKDLYVEIDRKSVV